MKEYRDTDTEGATDMATITGNIHITAEDAPIGVQLWPTRSPEFAPNYTLESVAVVRDTNGEHVTWTYQNGSQRHFRKGEKITARLS